MLEVKNLSKVYAHHGAHLMAIENMNCTIREREFVALVGPSGGGKTTLLKIIAGLEAPDAGSMLLDGAPVAGPGKDRGLIFQQCTLFPWLTVAQNIAFGLGASLSTEEKKAEVGSYLEATSLTRYAGLFPRQLSGGMRQRAALARTLAARPRVLLMDEPFGALDAQTREQMQELLLQLWQHHQSTVIFVTHDVSEAVFLADTVHVLTARPLQLKKTFTIPFARPRENDLKHSKEFFALATQVAHAVRPEK